MQEHTSIICGIYAFLYSSILNYQDSSKRVCLPTNESRPFGIGISVSVKEFAFELWAKIANIG